MTSRLATAKRVVVKIGSSTLVSPEGEPQRVWLNRLSADIATLKAAGKEVIVVSSGAIALGRRRLKLPKGALKLEEAQAAASVGQIALAQSWTEALAANGMTAAQILLTLDDTEERRRYLNARATLGALLSLGAVPVINENDTVATAEIRFGDNDRLAARVAVMVGADCLVLLSDIDGLYTDNPVRNPEAVFIPEIPEITPEIEAMAGRPGSDMGSGGMVTKLLAAKIATAGGCDMAIALGQIDHPLRRLAEGGRGTWLLARSNPAAARKQWILGALKPAGTLTVDAGAARALQGGKSLLPAGITAVDGAFERGDAVIVRDGEGTEIARGLAAYGSDDATRLIGRRSADIETVLGYPGRAAMIHRDDLVVL
ncbi:Glutamate 5-kinase [Alphaproteobacteria bacterium SO-S41]|nr:Glutamate 5-kinase [Alphaproteobacteria bacterium SO-S41]